MYNLDIIIGLQQGDEGKGKVSQNLIPNHNCVLKFNGGPNSGHTVYTKNKKKIELHQVASGIIDPTITVIIGPTCLVSVDKLKDEILEIEQVLMRKVSHQIKISNQCHLITQEHIDEDSKDNKIGTTKCGIGPAMSSKCSRTNPRIHEHTFNLFDVEVIDFFEYIHSNNLNILCEGSQGFNLDLDLGDYPYVTSSNCTVGQLLCNGLSWQCINRVYGVSKIYETYVGLKEFQDKNDNRLKEICELGNEKGVTTGRLRQCNWLNLSNLYKAMHSNGLTHIIFNKCDILKELGYFCVYDNDKLLEFNNWEDMSSYITKWIRNYFKNMNIIYSESPYKLL